LKQPHFPDLLAGFELAEDAAVYRLTDDLALVSTIDFFTPIVDDPYDFGRIAAANALSDIYAMGAKPTLALSIVCFPTELDFSILNRIMQGGMDVINQAGIPVGGGHSVKCPELKFGFAVNGLVHPDKIVANSTAKQDDILILTKPIGTGVLSTALKAEQLNDSEIQQLIDSMAKLNKVAAECMVEIGVNSATDVTGFGLLGHGFEMAKGSNVCLEIDYDKVPLLNGAIRFAQANKFPGGTKTNRKFVLPFIENKANLEDWQVMLLCDAQTSGGLLISVAPDNVNKLMQMIQDRKEQAWIIGSVVEKRDNPYIRLT
jgi:selenide, water dikinase